MANNLISAAFSGSVFSIVDSNSKQVTAANLKVRRVNIKLTSTPLKHMQEDGSTVVDSRIILPTKVSIEAFCPDAATLAQLSTLISDRGNFYNVTSKGLTIENVMVDSSQIKQSPDVMSALPIRLSFNQVLTESIDPIVFAQSSDSSLIDRGISSLSAATTSISNMAKSIVGGR